MSGERPTISDGGSTLVDLEVVEDRTKGSKADEGFLRVRRLVLRSVFSDGSKSAPYPCDIVSRSRVDAVAVVVFDERGPRGHERRTLRVALKTGIRAPVFLRRNLALTQPDSRPYGVIAEIVAGMLEPADTGAAGTSSRAAIEIHEEIGVRVDAASIVPLGAESFPSPGITDEKVHFAAAQADLDARTAPAGDGSAMEAGGGVVVMPIDDAIAACRSGEIPDMKTEIALLRLCDLVGYLPALGRFVDELPAELRSEWRPLGIEFRLQSSGLAGQVGSLDDARSAPQDDTGQSSAPARNFGDGLFGPRDVQ